MRHRAVLPGGLVSDGQVIKSRQPGLRLGVGVTRALAGVEYVQVFRRRLGFFIPGVVPYQMLGVL
ncbi:hypothetical protein ACQWHR_24825 [Salmonella enterica subsp. enterica serovar Infantis]